MRGRQRALPVWPPLLLLLLLIQLMQLGRIVSSERQQASSCPDNLCPNSTQAINKLPGTSDGQEEMKEEARVRRRSKSAGLLPSFATPIGNVTAVLGRDVRLVCTVDNLGSYQVAWLKEESKTIISIDTNIIITNYRIFLIPDEEERKWVLHIKDVQESDRGFYQCQVNTSPMRATSGYLEVVVPPTIVKSQSSQVVETTEHSNVNLQCKATGQPKPSIVWRRDDGAPIKLSGRQAGSAAAAATNDTSGPPELAQSGLSQLNEVKSDRLLLFEVDRSMAGIYVCSASNGIPADANRRIPLYVKFEPKTTVQTKLLSIGLGEPLELECLIEGFPKPASSWSKTSRNKQFREQFAASRWYPTAASGSAASPFAPNDSGLFEGQIRGAAEQADFAKDLPNSKPAARPTTAGDEPQNYRHSYHQSNPSQASVFSTSHPHNNRIKFKRQLDQLTPPGQSALAAAGSLVGAKEPLPAEAGERPPGVSLKQTALNPYTYKLQLSIAKMRPDDYGKYSCMASNPMGASEAHVLVTRSELPRATDKGHQRSSQQSSSDYRSVDELEYQRDSLAGQPEGQQANFRPAGGNRVVYDENYLQAIKSRQNGLAAGSRSQQRLKSKAKNKSGPRTEANRATIAILLITCLLYLAFGI